MVTPTNKPPIIVILGPTASGKSNLAIKLARKFGGFIISADSRQVYRYLDIGTAKVANYQEIASLKRQRAKLIKINKSPLNYVLYFHGIAHYMMDIISPQNRFSVAEYQQLVYQIIKNNLKLSSKLPILVGGTGLYIDAVVNNLHFSKTDPAVRESLENQAKEKGIETLYQQLIKLDPEAENFVLVKNPRRVIRALEVCLLNKSSFSKSRKKGPSLFNVLKIGINPPRKKLYQKIDKRLDKWLKMGLIKEVEDLMFKHGVSFNRVQQFGLEYRIIADYLHNRHNNIPQCLKWNIHKYARRQLTWFRRDCDIVWVKGYQEAEQLVHKFLKSIFLI